MSSAERFTKYPTESEHRLNIGKNSRIFTLEGQIHERRQSIKTLILKLRLYEALHHNDLMNDDASLTERVAIVKRMRELDQMQHLDRKKLRPFKKAREIKGKSPFKLTTVNVRQSQHKPVKARESNELKPFLPPRGVIFDNLPDSKQKTSNPNASKITALHQQLTNLWKEKKRRIISPKEYHLRQAELATQLHEEERKIGHYHPPHRKGKK